MTRKKMTEQDHSFNDAVITELRISRTLKPQFLPDAQPRRSCYNYIRHNVWKLSVRDSSRCGEAELRQQRGREEMTKCIDHLKGLVIAEPWISLILSGKKTREMRSKATSYRGPLAVITKGSGLVTGIVDLVDCIPGQHEAEYGASEALHCSPKAQHTGWAVRWPVAWVFANARSLAEPVPYKHKNGAQSRVLLSVEESVAVQDCDPEFDKASTTRSASPISASVTS
jgi:hypothetical protein